MFSWRSNRLNLIFKKINRSAGDASKCGKSANKYSLYSSQEEDYCEKKVTMSLVFVYTELHYKTR